MPELFCSRYTCRGIPKPPTTCRKLFINRPTSHRLRYTVNILYDITAFPLSPRPGGATYSIRHLGGLQRGITVSCPGRVPSNHLSVRYPSRGTVLPMQAH